MTHPATLPDDPLDPWLDSLAPSLAVFCRATGNRPWGFRIGARPDSTFHILTRGSAVLDVDGVDGRLELTAGDLVLLTAGAAHALRDRPESTVVTLEEAVERGTAIGKSFELGDGLRSADRDRADVMVCGGCRLGPVRADARVHLLPAALVHSCEPALVELLDRESEALSSGGEAVLTRILALLVIQALRAHLDQRRSSERVGMMWPSLARALAFLHDHLGTDLDMDDLCAVARLSPTSLNGRFREALGVTPIRYLRRARLERATELLANGGIGLERIARQVGYGSASTFSRAFRREFGMSPGAYRAGAHRSSGKE